MRQAHVKPCRECPWRRAHPAGWLGGYRPEQFTEQLLRSEHPLPCHMTQTHDDDSNPAVCAGSLVFMRNIGKLPRCPELVAQRAAVETDHENVFSRPEEFLRHHSMESVE